MKPHVHFIGIGGIGMSALALWFRSQGWTVSGSDLTESELTRILRRENVKLTIGHDKRNLPEETKLIIRTQAVSLKNPEYKEALRRRLVALTYPEMIGELTRHYETLAVAGAHGKSTTTAMLALILKRAKLNPTTVVGTLLKELDGKNFEAGSSPYLVLEADEYGRAFLHYSPALAVLTTIDKEHLDTYKNLAGIKTAFLAFLQNVKPHGIFVLNQDDEFILSLKSQIAAIAKRKSIKTFWFKTKSKAGRLVKSVLQIPGSHNVSNALAAFTAAQALGTDKKTALAALKSYRGAWRRLELKGNFFGAPVYDDYAHHPTEIKATLAALKDAYPERKIVCVFQPHQAERLKALFTDFKTAFDGADETLILPLYHVTGREGAKNNVTSETLARAIQKQQPKKALFYLREPEHIPHAIFALGDPAGKVIVMMGAGDIVNYTLKLLRAKPKRISLRAC